MRFSSGRPIVLGRRLWIASAVGEQKMTTSMAFRTDEQIASDVLNELKFDAQLQPNHIGLSVKDGIVTLTGFVDSYLKRWTAEDLALRIRGVKAVANDVEIRLPSAAERDDSELAAAALNAIQWDALIPDNRIQVSVSNGWVTLDGRVEWQYQKQDAERIVRRLRGVKGVMNQIVLEPAFVVLQLKEQIQSALERHADIDANRITVEVQDSKATLEGAVHSWSERDAADRAAWAAPGITAVDDRIHVEV
jgi:osmotically-inducible protein OsmY